MRSCLGPIRSLTSSPPTAFQLVTGRKWEGSAFGGARGRTDVPKIVDWYMDGKIDIDSLITHTMPLDEAPEGYRMFKDKVDGCVRAVFTP